MVLVHCLPLLSRRSLAIFRVCTSSRSCRLVDCLYCVQSGGGGPEPPSGMYTPCSVGDHPFARSCGTVLHILPMAKDSTPCGADTRSSVYGPGEGLVPEDMRISSSIRNHCSIKYDHLRDIWVTRPSHIPSRLPRPHLPHMPVRRPTVGTTQPPIETSYLPSRATATVAPTIGPDTPRPGRCTYTGTAIDTVAQLTSPPWVSMLSCRVQAHMC